MRNCDRFKNAKEAFDCFINENIPHVYFLEVGFGNTRANRIATDFANRYCEKNNKPIRDLTLYEFSSALSEKELLGYRSCGRHTLAEIKYVLRSNGFEIGNPIPINITDDMFKDWLFADCGDGCAKDARANCNVAKLKFKLLNKDAKLPCYKHEGDAGMDVCSIEDVLVKKGGGYCLISTGLSADIPAGYEIQVRPRSGLSSKGIVAMFGTVDSNYKGCIKVNLYNFGCSDFEIKKGDRIAQLVLSQVSCATVEETDDVGISCRGSNGFGSTGV